MHSEDNDKICAETKVLPKITNNLFSQSAQMTKTFWMPKGHTGRP